MDGSAVKSFIGKFAPGLATALGGPFAGMAVKGLCGAFGLGEDATLADVEKIIKSGQLTGEQILALKLQEETFMLKMKELDINSVRDLENIAAQDRASARQREVATGDTTPKILAYGVTLGFFGILAYMLRNEVPATTRDILNVMLGSLGTAWVAVITYYFGSSAGSKGKDELLFRSTPAQQVPKPPSEQTSTPREPRDRK